MRVWSGHALRPSLTRVNDFVDLHVVLVSHVANDGEDGEAGVDGREEADDVDHDGVSATPYANTTSMQNARQARNDFLTRPFSDNVLFIPNRHARLR